MKKKYFVNYVFLASSVIVGHGNAFMYADCGKYVTSEIIRNWEYQLRDTGLMNATVANFIRIAQDKVV